MGESKHLPLSDAEVAEAYEEEMKGPQGVSFTLRDDHLLARAHRALMLEALRRIEDGLAECGAITDGVPCRDADGERCAPCEARVKVRAAIKAATGGET